MRLIISREAPTREAMSRCVSGSSMHQAPVALLGELEQQARHAAVDVHQREASHVLGEVAHPARELAHYVQREARLPLDQRKELAPLDDRAAALLHRHAPKPSAAPPSSVTSPKYSPGPMTLSCTSRPCAFET